MSGHHNFYLYLLVFIPVFKPEDATDILRGTGRYGADGMTQRRATQRLFISLSITALQTAPTFINERPHTDIYMNTKTYTQTHRDIHACAYHAFTPTPTYAIKLKHLRELELFPFSRVVCTSR